jgi:hypothetical protein
MKRIVRLTESDLARIVRRVINEEGEGPIGMPNPSTQGAQQDEPRKGPLVGVMVVANQQGPVEFGQKIQFKFRGLSNAGTAPLTITKIMPMNDNMKIIDRQTPFILKPGDSFGFTAEQLLQKGGTSVENMDQNGVVDYEQRIMVMTDGKKQKYQLVCRQKMFFFDGNR